MSTRTRDKAKQLLQMQDRLLSKDVVVVFPVFVLFFFIVGHNINHCWS